MLFSKTDISDGFDQIPLTPTGALKLAVPLPKLPGEPKLLAILINPPMGWTEYTTAFSAATETIANLINVDLKSSNAMPQPHPVETLASTPVALDPSEINTYPIKKTGNLSTPWIMWMCI